MVIGGPSAAVIAAQVWGNTTRTLTSLVGGPIAILGQVQTTLAANTTLALNPSASTMTLMQLGVTAGAAGSLTRNLYDGTNSMLATTTAAGQTSVIQAITNSPAVYNRITNNDAVNAALFMYSGWQFQ